MYTRQIDRKIEIDSEGKIDRWNRWNKEEESGRGEIHDGGNFCWKNFRSRKEKKYKFKPLRFILSLPQSNANEL